MNTGPFVPERIEEWAYWITEREKVRKAKAEGKRPPWTDDPVIANNRYCNVRRMDDKVSIWMLHHWYRQDGYVESRTALIAGLLARMINRPETLLYLTDGKPFSKWDYPKFHKRMYEIKETGQPVFTNAYIINGASGGPKIEQVLGAIDECVTVCDKNASKFIIPHSLQKTALSLHRLRGVGSFISGQVVADLRWVLGDVEAGWWADRMDWAPPGPGSSRGMKYLLGKASGGSDVREGEFLPAVRHLVTLAQRHPTVKKVFNDRRLEAHDIQNTLCELSKYVRVKYGTGRAKNSFDARASYSTQQAAEL